MKKILLTGSEGYIATNFKMLYSNYIYNEYDKKIDKSVLDYDPDNQLVDFIVHLAGISGITDCEKNPDLTFYDNVFSTLHLMRISWLYNIPMIFASSQGVKNPSDSLYTMTKRIGELKAIEYNKSGGNIKCLRFSNVFGGENYLETKNSVISKFLNASKNNESLKIDGDGLQTRDFIHVEEVCRAIKMCLNYNKITYPIDVGTGIERNIKEVAEMISNNIIFNGKRNSGVNSNVANTKELFDYIGFKTKDKLKNYLNIINKQ